MEHLDELISLILGVFTPAVISWFKGNTWTKRQKMLLSLAISTSIGSLTALTTHSLILHEAMTLEDWISNCTVIFTTATATYKLYFEDTDLNHQLEDNGWFSQGGA